jgi:hypothetical protein
VVISASPAQARRRPSKIVLQHLAFRGPNEGAVEGLDKKIIETNPILESFFGTRRPSATRMKLQFNENGKARNLLAGGMIEMHLLEKSCLVFYQRLLPALHRLQRHAAARRRRSGGWTAPRSSTT